MMMILQRFVAVLAEGREGGVRNMPYPTMTMVLY